MRRANLSRTTSVLDRLLSHPDVVIATMMAIIAVWAFVTVKVVPMVTHKAIVEEYEKRLTSCSQEADKWEALCLELLGHAKAAINAAEKQRHS